MTTPKWRRRTARQAQQGPATGAPSRLSAGLRRVRVLLLGRVVTDVSSVLRTSSALLAGQVLLAINGLVSARLLGPAGKGLVSAVLTWMQLLIWISASGLSIAALVQIPRRCDDERTRPACVGVAIGNALAFVLVAGAMVVAVAALFLPRTLAHLGPEADGLALCAIATVPIGMLGTTFSAVHLAIGNRGRYDLAQVVNPLVMLAVTVLFVTTSRLTTARFVAGAIAGTFAACLVGGRDLPWRAIALELKTLTNDLRFGFKAQLGSLFRLTNLRLDFLVMSAALPSRELGLYSTAINVLLPLFTLPAAVSTLLSVKVAKGSDEGSKRPGHAQLDVIRAEASRYTLLAIVVGLGLGIGSVFGLPAVVGDEYRESVGLLWLLLPGSVLFCYTTIATAGAVALLRVRVGVLAEGVAAAATVVLLPVLLPSFGAKGAAITSSVAYSLSALTAAWSLSRLDRELSGSPPASGK